MTQHQNEAKKECKEYEVIREKFFELFDTEVPKNKNGLFNFEGQSIDAKSAYELFYKLDYQARKLRGLVVKGYDLKAE